MAKKETPRSKCAKDAALDVGPAIQVELLPDDASLEQREVYIKKQAVAAKRARRKELKYSWCIGREIPKIKAEKDLNNNEADAYFKATFGFGVRQGNNYEQLWQAFPSIEEMLQNVPASASLSTAVDIARSLIDPDPTPDPVCPPDHVDDDGENKRTPAESGSGEKPPTNNPPACTPARGAKAAKLTNDIIRIVGQLGDDDLALLREVHGLLTKMTKAKDDTGSGNGRGKAKRRKAS